VGWVNYPGLDDHPQHALLQRQMRGASGLLAFGVKGGQAAGVRFIEAAQFMSHLVNIGDTRTLISHPASTTHRQLDDGAAGRRRAGPDMVRISVGLEHIDDILWDIDQALARSQAPLRPGRPVWSPAPAAGRWRQAWAGCGAWHGGQGSAWRAPVGGAHGRRRAGACAHRCIRTPNAAAAAVLQA
jgi:hypothetical protein